MWKKIIMTGCFVIASATLAIAGDVATYKDDFNSYPFLSDASPNWVSHNGRWEVTNGALHQLDEVLNGGLIFLDGKSFSDCQIKVKFNPAGNEKGVRAAGVVFRAKDCKNFYWIHFDSRNSQVVLARCATNNGWIVIQRAPKNKMVNGQWHDAEVTAVGNLITVKLNGKTVIEKKDNALTEGRVGLRVGQGLISFDDFEVTGRLTDDSKFVMTKVNEDKTTPRFDVPRVIVTKNCGQFPVMVHLGGQKIGAVIRAGAGHIGIRGRLDWITSEDGGKTWSKPSVIVDSPVDDRNPAAFVTEDGKIVVLYAEASMYDKKGQWDTKAGFYKLFQVESRDGGKSWSEKKSITFAGHVNYNVYGQGIILANGDILIPWYWSGGGFIRSTDGGKTWAPPQVIMKQGCSEIAMVEIAANEILAIARADGLFALRSKDNGKTWSKPVRITDKGFHPASIIKLADGKLFLTYGSRNRPYGVKVAISSDNGKTWSDKNTAFVTWDSANNDCGYPSAVQLADGSVAIISYAVGSSVLAWDIQSQCVVLAPAVLEKLAGKINKKEVRK